jgi:lysozyme family protein
VNDDLFLHAVTNVLESEGGKVEHPRDPGGRTNYGITQNTYNAWRDSREQPRADVFSMTREEAISIYHERYWRLIPPVENDALRVMAFDAAVNHGVSRALAWLHLHPTLTQYTATRLRFYAGLTTFTDFGRGWTRRMAHVLDGIHAWRAKSAPAPEPPQRLSEHRALVLHDLTWSDVLAVVLARLRGERSVALGRALASVGEGDSKLDVRRLP